MKEILDIENAELESRISNLIELVENQPDEWYKLLIERVVKQEVALEKLTKEVDEFKKFEQLNSAIIDSGLLQSPTILKDNYEVRASSKLLPDQGFYNSETSGAGLLYRWTKQNFYFDIPVRRETEKKIKLHLSSAIKPELLEHIVCYANESEIFLEKTSSKKGVTFKGILEKTSSSNITRLSFHTTAAYTPKELNPEVEDSRELAVTFTKLTISQ